MYFNERFYKTSDNKCVKGNITNCLTQKDGNANEWKLLNF